MTRERADKPTGQESADAPSSLLSSEFFTSTVDEVRKAGTAGLTGRFAYLALTGQLETDMTSIKREIASVNTTVSRDVMANLSDMESKGWQFLKTDPNVPVQGEYNYHSRRLWYQPQGSMARFILGADQSPIKETAPIVAHEAAHHNRVPFAGLTGNDAVDTVLAKRALQSETDAMLTQVHISDRLGVIDRLSPDASTDLRREALRKGTLGSLIYDKDMRKLEVLGPEPVDGHVRNYIAETYGANVVDPKTGQVRPFDLRNGWYQNVETLPGDAALLQSKSGDGYLKARTERMDFRSPFAQRWNLGEHGWQSTFTHGANALAAVGLAVAANDIAGAFQKGTGDGAGRLASVATGFAGYEAATRLALPLLRSIASLNPYVRTALTVAAGFTGATAADITIGHELENGVKKLFAGATG